MQEMIVLQTQMEKESTPKPQSNAAARRPIVVCRPEEKPSPRRDMKSQETLQQETEDAAKTSFAFLEDDSEQARDLPENEPPRRRIAVSSDIRPRQNRPRLLGKAVRAVGMLLILGGFMAGYPKLCPVLDRFCYQLLALSDGFTQDLSEKSPEPESTVPSDAADEPQATDPQEQPEFGGESEFIASVSDETSQLIEGTIANTDGDGVVSSKTYSASAGGIYVPLAHGMVKNATTVSNAALAQAAKQKPAFTLSDTDAPQVLILHTHATESYLSKESENYDTGASFRTRDNSQNIIRVGEAIAAQLQQAGIGVVQDKTQHDYPSYTGSYARSAETVKKYLKQYPSIKIVLDIHRDAIGSGKTMVAPTTTIDGRKAAQLMIISGCDNGSMNMPNYMKNFSFAAALENRVEQMYPTLTRPVLFDYRKYNQDLSVGSLLVEIGSNVNTLNQAVYTGTLFGKALAAYCGGETHA